MKTFVHSRILFMLAAGLLCTVPAVLAAQAGDAVANDAEAQARQAWRLTMHHTGISDTGCFHASYPSTQWEKVECAPPSRLPSARPRLAASEPDTGAGAQTVGGGYDFVAQAPAGEFFSYALGSFPTTSGVTSEKTVNVPFGGGYSTGIPGPNEYTLQLNTNYSYTAACGVYTGCQAWQQYFIQTNGFGGSNPHGGSSQNLPLMGTSSVGIEYWLLNYGVHNGSNICPPPYEDFGQAGTGDDCVRNSPLTVFYDGQFPITDLASLQLSGSAVANGTDVAIATDGTEAYAATVKDSYTDISSVWNQVEFNVFGNQNGAEAVFNEGSSLTLNIGLEYGSTNVPTCVPPGRYQGTTGETNNLKLGATCTFAGGSSPYIEFTESN